MITLMIRRDDKTGSLLKKLVCMEVETARGDRAGSPRGCPHYIQQDETR